MKQFIQTICVLTLIAGFIFGGPRKMLKSDIQMTKMERSEPDYRRGEQSRDECPYVLPNNPNSELTLIDSSSNGYGMWATVTRPMNVMSDGNMLVVYRQYAGPGTTHGQLGAGYGVVQEDGPIEWDVQLNVNYNGNPPWGGGGVGGCGSAQARYPSSLASEEYPYAIYNEYTGGPPTCPAWPSECSSYGGRPYFSYDEFGWGGESWLYPVDLDPLYDCSKDLWQGSVGYGYDATQGEHHVSVVYDDWTRGGSYLFTSEAVEDGYIVLGTETLIINPQHLGTDGYSSSAILSMNDNGQGLLGLDGIFAGAEPDAGPCGSVCGPPASNLTCNKTPMFKLTDDFGQSWQGNHGAFDLYYVPDAVFDDIFDTWPSEVVIDPCTGATEPLCGYWSWYDFDMRVDNEGNPHIVISLLGETENAFPTIPGKSGFYHMTIDRDMLANNHDDNPQWINTPEGWNWSYIPLPANDSFDWFRPDGSTGYLFGSMCQISLSRDNPDIVYMVSNIAEKGPMSSEHDADGDGIEDDLCGEQDWPWELYPEWSEDIWVAKSSDNGSTWTALENLTKTPRDINGIYGADVQHCSPEEQLVHTAHWSEDERVYYQFHQPNWGWNEIGDLLGADHMNRVVLGYSWVTETGVGGCTDSNNCSYDAEAAFDDGSCGVGSYPCANGDTGCGCAGECADGLEPPTIVDCNDVCDGGASLLCRSLGNGGGEYCAPAGTEVCSESNFNDDVCGDGDTENINEWSDCDGEHCGINDPLFYDTGCADAGFVACDGGRCWTCAGCPTAQTYGECIDCMGSSEFWDVETVGDCLDTEPGCNDVVTDEVSCSGQWVTFANEEFDANENPSNEIGDPNECYCSTDAAQDECEIACSVGDVNGDGSHNVLDIVGLANCVLATNCGAAGDAGCAADVTGDGTWNVLDIVQLANCVLAQNCDDLGRAGDASHSKLIIDDNIVSIEADGFVGGVEMTLTHGDGFSIEMTDRAHYFAKSLTIGNETRLLVIAYDVDHTIEDELFSFEGDFEITEIIVANTQYEVSVDIPLVTSFSISEAYPNPFNPTTTMTLTMPVSGEVTVEVYNVLGQVVATLASGYMDASTHTLTWDASNASSGVYFVQADVEGGLTKTQKLMLLK